MSDVYDEIVNERGPDITLAADAGIDLEIADVGDGLPAIRISARPGSPEPPRVRRAVRVTGDACVSVSAIPHVMLDEHGELVHAADYGMVVIGSTCTPCCQCADYYAAVLALSDVQKKLSRTRKRLSDSGDTYEKTVKQHGETQELYERGINSPKRVRMSCAKMWGRTTVIDGKAHTAYAASVSIMNMTASTAILSDTKITDSASGAISDVSWAVTAGTTGLNQTSGHGSIPSWVSVSAGGTLSITAVFDVTGTLSSHFTASTEVDIDGRARKTITGGA